MTFKFLSKGAKGEIWKIVQFKPVEKRGYYNLAFGNLRDDGSVDDVHISDNGDRDKVLATVVLIMFSFLDQYPRCKVIFHGNTPARTRLYRMAINKGLKEIQHKYVVEGLRRKEDGMLYLQKFKGHLEYEAFIVRKRRVSEYPKPPP